MSLKRIGPLLVAAALVSLLGCSQTRNHDPIIGSISATPDGTVRPGDQIVLSISATDEDGDELTFSWSATAGTLSASTGDRVTWTAPSGAATAAISVTCSDGQGGEDTKTKNVTTRDWYYDNMDGATSESTYLANPGTAEAAFTFEMDEPFPAGAVVESAFVTTDFEPLDELELEQFNVWAVSPSGTRVLIYDGFNLTTLDVDDLALDAFQDESAEGTWKLRITRQAKGIEGYADECEMTVYYRY